jgi:hypothetical protein
MSQSFARMLQLAALTAWAGGLVMASNTIGYFGHWSPIPDAPDLASFQVNSATSSGSVSSTLNLVVPINIQLTA